MSVICIRTGLGARSSFTVMLTTAFQLENVTVLHVRTINHFDLPIILVLRQIVNDVERAFIEADCIECVEIMLNLNFSTAKAMDVDMSMGFVDVQMLDNGTEVDGL